MYNVLNSEKHDDILYGKRKEREGERVRGLISVENYVQSAITGLEYYPRQTDKD